jgi:quinol monooxygenase YgiN
MHDEEEDAMSKVTVGLWVALQAKEGKEAEVEEFLEVGQALVEDEPGTTAWLAVQMGPGRFGIFDVFADDAGRQAHLNGKGRRGADGEGRRPVRRRPQIHQIDVLAEKL